MARRTRRSSEPEPADSLGNESNFTCGWLPSLTFAFCLKMKTQRLSKRNRFRAGKTMPWPDVLHDFDCFSSVNPEYEPMRQLVYDLHSCAASDLHATQTMGGNFLLSPEEELHRNDNVLLISYCPKEKL